MKIILDNIEWRWLCWVVVLLFSSCASLAKYPGVGRIKRYQVESEQLPPAFDGFKIAFASDFHYPSKLTPKRLRNVVAALQSFSPDVLMLGGDYQEDCACARPLFEALSQVRTPYGTYAVMGNHDEHCRDSLAVALGDNNIRLLEHTIDTLRMGDDSIFVCGVRNPFDLTRNGVSPSLALPPDDFIVMLTHTPDYADDVEIGGTDLVLAGHTHGGQVTLLYLYAPARRSKYGYLTGRCANRDGIPIIVTNGLGTSNRKVRFCAPSEVVLVTLKKR